MDKLSFWYRYVSQKAPLFGVNYYVKALTLNLKLFLAWLIAPGYYLFPCIYEPVSWSSLRKLTFLRRVWFAAEEA